MLEDRIRSRLGPEDLKTSRLDNSTFSYCWNIRRTMYYLIAIGTANDLVNALVAKQPCTKNRTTLSQYHSFKRCRILYEEEGQNGKGEEREREKKIP
jgi:hypothetical protein